MPALSEYYREEIEAKQAQLEHIQRTYHTLQPVLAKLSRLDYRLAELAYLGPKDTRERESWLRRPTWYTIAAEMDMSETQARVHIRANSQRRKNEHGRIALQEFRIV